MTIENLEKQFDTIFSEKPNIKYVFEADNLGYKDKKILSFLEGNTFEKKVLDIGPGTGRWLQFMRSQGADFLGAIDISQEALKRVELLCDKTQKANLEFDSFDFEDSFFDIVVSFEVLEHLNEPYKFISEIKRVTKKGGFILLSLPNLISFISRIRLIFGLLPPVMSMDETHVGFYRQKDLISLFARYNLKPEFVPTSISLNPTNPKSRFCVRSLKSISNLDDSHLFVIKL